MRVAENEFRAELSESDLERAEELALALAQSTIQNAIDESGIPRAEVARRMGRSRSFVTRIMSGSHNLTVKTLARVVGACGQEIRFQRTPAMMSWDAAKHPMETSASTLRVSDNQQLALAA